MWTYQRAGSNEAETISTNSSVLRIVSSQNVGLYTCSIGDPAMSEVFQAISKSLNLDLKIWCDSES